MQVFTKPSSVVMITSESRTMLIKVAGTNTEEAITATSNVRLCIQIQGGVSSFDVDS